MPSLRQRFGSTPTATIYKIVAGGHAGNARHSTAIGSEGQAQSLTHRRNGWRAFGKLPVSGTLLLGPFSGDLQCYLSAGIFPDGDDFRGTGYPIPNSR
jgi:hypothetical protein